MLGRISVAVNSGEELVGAIFRSKMESKMKGEALNTAFFSTFRKWEQYWPIPEP